MLKPVESTYVPQYVPIPTDRFVEAARRSEERGLLSDEATLNVRNALSAASTQVLPDDAGIFDSERQAVQNRIAEISQLPTYQRLRGIKQLASEFGSVAAPLQARYVQYNKDLDGIRQLGLTPEDYASAVAELNSKYKGVSRSDLIQGSGLPEILSGNLTPYVDMDQWVGSLVQQVRADQIGEAELSALGIGSMYQYSETTGWPDEVIRKVAEHRLENGQGAAYLRQRARWMAQRDPSKTEQEWYELEKSRYAQNAVDMYARQKTDTKIGGSAGSGDGDGSGSDGFPDVGSLTASNPYITIGNFSNAQFDNITYDQIQNSSFDTTAFQREYIANNPIPNHVELGISRERAREIRRNPNEVIRQISGRNFSRSGSAGAAGMGTGLQGSGLTTKDTNELRYAREFIDYNNRMEAAAVDNFRNNANYTYSEIAITGDPLRTVKDELVRMATRSGSNYTVYELTEDGEEQVTKEKARTIIANTDLSSAHVIPPNALNNTWRIRATISDGENQPRTIILDIGGNTGLSSNIISNIGQNMYINARKADPTRMNSEAVMGRLMERNPQIFDVIYTLPTRRGGGDPISVGVIPGLGNTTVDYKDGKYIIRAQNSNQVVEAESAQKLIDTLGYYIARLGN